jgi:predicted O-methyltransferase YrrM
MRHYHHTRKFGKENWFGWQPLYAEMVRRYPGGTFVELGSWKGRSTAFLGVEIINADTGIRAYAVDVWSDDISGGAKKTMDEQGLTGNTLYDLFIENVAPVSSVITPMRMTTVQAASQFADGSVDFVFVDADHSYEGCKQDIHAWLPKVKHGGILAGHDYGWAGSVQRAVHDTLGAYDWRDPWNTGCFIATIMHGTPETFHMGVDNPPTA